MKLLVAEDDPVTRESIETALSREGFIVFAVENGVHAVAAWKTEKPDLICLDIQMPDEWGPRFYRKLRKDKELKDTPIIVISGIDGDHAVKDAVAFVKKPFDPEKLIGIVKNTIG